MQAFTSPPAPFCFVSIIDYTQTKNISPFFGNEQRRDVDRLYYRLYTDQNTSPISETNKSEIWIVCINIIPDQNKEPNLLQKNKTKQSF